MASHRLPVVIVPGFCSTRLEVAHSDVCPSWKGRKVWLGLSSIGFSAMHGKGTFDNEEALSLKNKWLRHLVLADPESESSGVRLRPVEGLEGVKYLDPDSFMGLAAEASYVFAPVIKALADVGYVEGVDLIAATFDWRFAPSVLEKRDGYFSSLIDSIETLNESNGPNRQRGVVLLAHSMGNKVVSYFLEFAKQRRGQAWLDRHVHTWIAAGAPHLGAAQALRSTIFGDKFGLDAFVTNSEAIAFGRSLSACPWLFPIGSQAESCCFQLRRGGALEIKPLSATVGHCGIASVKNKIMMALEVCWGACGKVESLSTNSAKSFDGNVATFDASENFLQFGGPEELPPGASIKAIIKEKGMARDEPEHWLKRVGEGLAAGVMLAEEAAHHRRSWGLPKAHTEPLPLEVLRRSEDFVELDLPISRTAGGGVPCAMGCFRASEAGDFVRLQVRWLSFRKLKQMWVGSEDLGGSNSLKPPLVELRHRDPKTVYEPIGVEQVLKMERAERIIETWRRYYEGDPVYDHLGTSLPSCKRVRAVHGVNRATEKAFALRVNTVRLKKSQMLTRLTLDDEAMVSDSGLSIKGGIVYFNGSDAELSGDGVVNAASMNVCQQWAKSGVDVGVTFLPGVEHRAMLADSFFHQAIKQVVLTPEEKAQPGASFSIAGSFNEWSSEVMTWDGTCFVYVVRIGAGGSESFHVLADGSCEAVLYPSVKDANPKVHHTVQGPDRKPPPGFLWTIASKKILKDGLPQGTGIKVKLEVNDAGAAQRVLWDPFVPLQPVRDGAWQVEAGGTWMDFPPSAHSQLCAARAKLKPETTIEMNGRRYKIDFLNMLQTNLATKKQRKIRWG